MYTLGIPKRQYRRATSVLGPESAEPIEYDSYKQDDGFWQFSFPGVDEYAFRDIVMLLKRNGITTLGADKQLTEKKIMKLSKLIRDLKTEGTMSIDVPPLGGGTGGPMGGGGTVNKDEESGRVKKPGSSDDNVDSINEQGSPDENDLIDILRDRLKRMESKDYRGGGLEGCDLSNHYLEEIRELIEDYDEETTMNRPSDLPAFGGLNEIYNSLTEQDPFQDLYDKQNPNDPKAIPGKHFPDDAAKKRMAQDAASLGKGSSGRITKVQKLKMSDIQDEITINQKVGSCSQPNNVDKCLDDVTISWGNESHTVSFEYGGVIDDYGIDRGVDAEFQADSDDGRWQFILDVQGANGIEDDDCNPCIQGYDWDELIIQDHPDDESHLDPEDRSDYDPVVEIEDDEDLRLEPEDDEYEDGTEFEDDDLRLEPEDDYVDKFKLEKLTFDQIVNAFPNNYQDVHFTRKQPNGEEGPYYRDGINFPNMDDSLTHIGDANAWEDWKKKTMRHYGNVEIVLNDQGKNWFDKVFVSDDKFNGDKDSFIRGKMKALNR